MRKSELVADIVESMRGCEAEKVLARLFGRLSVDARMGDSDAVKICKAIAGVLDCPGLLEEAGLK